MSDIQDTFKEMVGLPANEHAKKKAKEKSAKKPAFQKEVYTIKNGKILRVVLKPNGAYNTYVDSLKKIGQAKYKVMVDKWLKEGKWVHEHEAEDMFEETIIKLAQEKEAHLTAKAKR